MDDSFCNSFGCFTAADREAGEIIEVDKPEMSFLVNDDIPAIDGYAKLLGHKVGIALDVLSIKPISFLFSVYLFVPKFRMSRTCVIPVEEISSLNTIELDEISLLVFLRNPCVNTSRFKIK